MKPIALFSDRHMLPGLHVTLTTLLRTLAPEEANQFTIHLFLDGVSNREKVWLQHTHDRHTRGTGLILHDFPPIAPAGSTLYYGNATAYGRLSLADLLPQYNRCLYLDCDLYIHRSIAPLFDAINNSHVLIVGGRSIRGSSVDKELFLATGIDLNGPYFNSGVMGINLGLWRKQEISSKCATLTRQHGHLFQSADQAILNTVLHDSFISIGEHWNTSIHPSTPSLQQIENRIYHFEYSPKPWDPFGHRLHRNYSLWKSTYSQTAISHRSPLLYTSLKRIIKIATPAWKSWSEKP